MADFWSTRAECLRQSALGTFWTESVAEGMQRRLVLRLWQRKLGEGTQCCIIHFVRCVFPRSQAEMGLLDNEAWALLEVLSSRLSLKRQVRSWRHSAVGNCGPTLPFLSTGCTATPPFRPSRFVPVLPCLKCLNFLPFGALGFPGLYPTLPPRCPPASPSCLDPVCLDLPVSCSRPRGMCGGSMRSSDIMKSAPVLLPALRRSCCGGSWRTCRACGGATTGWPWHPHKRWRPAGRGLTSGRAPWRTISSPRSWALGSWWAPLWPGHTRGLEGKEGGGRAGAWGAWGRGRRGRGPEESTRRPRAGG